MREFPPVDQADEDGILCVGGDLEVDSLLLAYRSGIFPWPVSAHYPLVWFAPPRRALLFLNEVHIPKSLRKLRKANCTFSVDRSFPEVIRACAAAKNRRLGPGTWITPEMVSGYIELHRRGWCHSFECWIDGALAGGLYGVSIGKMFAGESMFYHTPNASKLALWYLTEWLSERGAEWIDCQQVTPLLKSFGARTVTREHFGKLLGDAVNAEKPLFPETSQDL